MTRSKTVNVLLSVMLAFAASTTSVSCARVGRVIARLKDWQILRQCRRRGQAINHSLQIFAGLFNLKTHNQLLVNS